MLSYFLSQILEVQINSTHAMCILKLLYHHFLLVSQKIYWQKSEYIPDIVLYSKNKNYYGNLYLITMILYET